MFALEMDRLRGLQLPLPLVVSTLRQTEVLTRLVPTRLVEPFLDQLLLFSLRLFSSSQPFRPAASGTALSHTMADTYLSFLRSPSESALASDAALHYITTTTSIHDCTAIIKHYQAQEKVLKKKSENVLSSYGSSDGAVVETETTFEFIRGGGTILPQMDDNMLADSIATLPMVGTGLHTDKLPRLTHIRYTSSNTTLKARSARSDSTGTKQPSSDRSKPLARVVATGPSVTAQT